jgi:ubiquinone/menaquinone biosynthesis C-methylase UbiE
MNIVLWIAQVLLGLSFLGAGYMHCFRAEQMKTQPGRQWVASLLQFAPDLPQVGKAQNAMGNRDFSSGDSQKSNPESNRWNAIAQGWHQWIPRMREWYAPATELMLDLARIGPGSHVLDVAAGDGDQSLAAAARVGPSGYVLATDLAEQLLVIAEQSAKEANLKNFETRVMDGENLALPDASFDAVICRFALMFFPDPDRGLREMNRVLRPGGRVSVVVYGVNGSPEFSRALSIVRRRKGLTEGGQPAATSLGVPRVLRQKLETAGFREVEVHSLALPMRLVSAAECVRYLQDSSPTLREMLLPCSPQEQEETWQEVEEALSEFEGPTGFEVYHQVLVAAGSVAG